jgi:putative phosphoribosyl transferase
MAAAEVELRCAGVVLNGELVVPERAQGVVLLASGRGGLRRRDDAVARTLHPHGWATLVLDLLPRGDARVDPFAPLDTETLTQRLVGAVDWFGSNPVTAHLPVVLLGFGGDTDAVLAAAASRPDQVESVAVLGVCADLNVPVEWVRAPVMLVLAAVDDEVGAAEQEELRRRLRVPFRVESIDSDDPHLAEADARERAVGVVARWLRHPSSFRSAGARERRAARAQVGECS